MQEVCKHFPGVQALDHVGLRVRKGRVHALMGENGAGKSTLLKCLFGIYRMDSGRILMNGKSVKIDNVRNAMDQGVSFIQQELSPVLDRSIMENIWLAREPMIGKVFVDHRKMYASTKKLMEEFGLKADPKDKVSTLTVAKMQLLEIIKAVSCNARLVVMDEPTSALTNTEVDQLFQIITRLKAQGVSVIYVSHKMDEIFEICDDVTVMRDGRWIADHEVKDITMEQLVFEMVGRTIEDTKCWYARPYGELLLEAKGLTSPGSFYDIDIKLRRGEILGIAGLVGAGRTEVLESLFGLRHLSSGEIKIRDKSIKIQGPKTAMQNGLALLTEDRRYNGIIPVLSVAENILVANYDHFSNKAGFINKQACKAAVCECIQKLQVKTPSSATRIETLSGGNQQKALFARWVLFQADILLLDEPTRGIDVGAKTEIYNLILELASQGKGVIVVSSEMPELIKLCDRMVVMAEGHQAGWLEREEFDQEKILTYASMVYDNCN